MEKLSIGWKRSATNNTKEKVKSKKAEVGHAEPRVIDRNPAGDRIGSVPEEKATRVASRYDAVIATFVGLCALCVSGYTAYMQRQQVRAAVWAARAAIRNAKCS